MAKKNKGNFSEKTDRLKTGHYCVVLGGRWKPDFIFNEYSLDWKDHDGSGQLAVFKKRLTGYSWTRTYDEKWEDHTSERYGSGDPETNEFPALEAYLNEKGIIFSLLKKTYQKELLSMAATESYMDDPYYGSAEEEITYILLEDIDDWLKKINSEDYMKETFEEWLEKNFKKLEGLCEYNIVDKLTQYSYTEGKYNYINKFKEIKDPTNLYVHNSWFMGGSYGNCWDDSMSYSDGDIKPEFISLDKVVELINPDLSYIKYRTKVIPLVESYVTSQGDYYGGSTKTGHERVNIYELWKALNAV